MNKKSTLWIIIVLAIVVVGGVYWFVQGGPGEENAEGPAAQMAEHPVGTPTGATMGTTYVAGNLLLGTNGDATHGTYLIGFNGQTLYTYDKDTATASNCTGTCATAWPPYLVPGTSALSDIQAGIPGKVGTVTRADGTLQVTYNGKPLYFYVGDTTQNAVTGDGVKGVWHLATP